MSATFTADPPQPPSGGGQPTQGPTGQPGATGGQGQTGSTGTTGGTGTARGTGMTGGIVGPGRRVRGARPSCQSTASASLVCSLRLATGTATTGGGSTTATFAVDRGGRRLRPGRYVVTITVSSGHHHAILPRQRITIRPPR